MSRRAFRFLGHMAERSQRLMQAVSSKNVPKAILEAGINILELIGDVVHYNETTRQTGFMEQHERNVVKNSRMKRESADKIHEQNMLSRQEQHIQDLQLEQKKLSLSLDKLKQTMHTQSMIDVSVVEEDRINQQLLGTYLKQFNHILSMMEEYIKGIPIQDNESKQRLFEDFREVQKKMNQLIE